MKLASQDIRTFFVTAGTHQRKPLFTSEALSTLFLNLLRADRKKNRYAIHEYVFMPDHIHLLLTPAPYVSLEKTMQFIKGGFSFRAKKEAAFRDEVWQARYNEHRIKDADDYIARIFGRIRFVRGWCRWRVNIDGRRHIPERMLIPLRRG